MTPPPLHGLSASAFALLHFIVIVIASASGTTTTTTTTTSLPTDEHGDYNGSDLIDWIRSHPEGIIHLSLRIGRERPGDLSSPLGLFVKNDAESIPISKGDVIARIPWDMMIQPGGKYHPYKFFSCRAIYNLANELDMGEHSDKAPYVRYLLSQKRGNMPGEWSRAGSNFLASEILGNGDLPPYEDSWRAKFDVEWSGGCSGTDATADPIAHDNERRAYWLASSRDEDTLMVPVYDMANHSNDPVLLNTVSYKPARAGDAFLFVSSRDIASGEQIYNSYNRCNACSGMALSGDCETYSYARTPDLYVNFGFVEDYPQYWEFDPQHKDDDSGDDSSDDDDDDDETGFEFCLIRDEVSGELAARYIGGSNDMPDAADVAWMTRQLNRLRALSDEKERLEGRHVRGADGDGNGDVDGDPDKMPRSEWESSWRYHDALSRAIEAAIRSVSKDHNILSDGEL
ncbi:hypothetical protein ACHAXA_003293 [Cyclostephanos tholiformis]|uniref:SET domain-containing protein n=1 Tax=Cyclostephanos tholiformis TaxID=382380 RepID=A0ABD3RD35_9STRA